MVVTISRPEPTGNDKLLLDIEQLMVDTKAGTFHDFKSAHATPKVQLTYRLQEMINKARNGVYDD